MIRLAVRVRREHAELVLAELLELSPGGVEEAQPDPDTVEYAVYGPPGELPSMPQLDAVAGAALVEISSTEVADDWHERWKRFHRPLLTRPPAPAPGGPLVPAVHVRPPWERPSEDTSAIEIVIDPGQAFGTGAHASTRLCLGLLLELLASGAPMGPLVDVGTGSGVLAIAAAQLGFTPVLALDNERESVLAARSNALANAATVEVLRYDLRREPLPAAATGAAAITANLLRPLLLDLALALERADARPRHVIAGGLLEHELDEITLALARAARLHERARRVEGEWAAVWLQAR